VAKAVSGIGIFASSMVLLVIGFPEQATPGEVSEAVVRNLGLVYLPALGVIYLMAIFCLNFFRITRQSHEETLEALAKAAAGPVKGRSG
jgi:Na+/melibiose symporter-like transporter